MQTKDEILKKKGKFPEQLDLVKNLEGDKNKTKNRLLLILILLLTVGTSVGLWIFREYKDNKLNFNFALKLPSIQTPVTTDKNIWEICLFDKNNNSLLFSQNCKNQNIPNITINNNIDLIKNNLPNGLIINEQISTPSSEINYVSDISSPKFSFLLTIKIFGSNPLDSSQKLIPKIASDLYWSWSR